MKKKLIALLASVSMCLSLGTFAACETGPAGQNGADGKSAYQSWLDSGHTGTEAEFVEWLKGAQGEQGDKGDQGEQGIQGEKGDKGDQGEQGIQGEKGDKGDQGEKGDKGDQGEKGDKGDDAEIIPCEHDFYQYTLKEATCISQGVILNVCETEDGCGAAYITYTETNPHNHDESSFEETVVAPTCTEQGYTTARCACGYEEGAHDFVDALEHDFDEVTTRPTCEKDGYITKTCLRDGCGHVETIEATEENGLLAKGHSDTKVWINVVDENANICENGGQKLLVCEDCLQDPACRDCEDMVFDMEEIPANGHAVTVQWTLTKAPTTTETGTISGFCATCGTNATHTLPMLNQTDYTFVTERPATCTEYGVAVYSITVGEWTDSFRDRLDMHKHTNVNGEEMDLNGVFTSAQVDTVFGNAPTTCFDESGRGSFECKECGIVYLVAVKGDHVFSPENLIEEVASTCTQQGHKTYKCAACDEEHTEFLPLLDHSYGEPTVTVEGEGDEAVITLTFTCENCDHEDEIVCSDYDRVETPATCQADGSIVYTYTYGDNEEGTYTVVLPQKAHSYGDTEFDLKKTYTLSELKEIFGDDLNGLGMFGNSPTDCSTSGKASFVCGDCGTQFLIDIMGDHDWELIKTNAADCTTGGSFDYECKICGESKNEENIADPAKGHTLVLNEEDSNFEEGSLKFNCSVCNHTETIEADDFTLGQTDATCTTAGERYVEYTYTVDGEQKSDRKVLEILPIKTSHIYGETEIFLTGKVYTMTELKAIFGDDLNGLTLFGNSLANCEESGQASFKCDHCHQAFLINIMGDHSYGDWTYVGATCEEKGYNTRTCSVCNHVENSDPVADALGHSYEYEVTGATVDVAGKLVIRCANGCDMEREVELPALSADNGYVVDVISEATCGQEGLTTYTYTVEVDGDTTYTYVKSVVTPIVEHVGVEPPVEFTWEYDGHVYTGYFCGVCEQIIVRN